TRSTSARILKSCATAEDASREKVSNVSLPNISTFRRIVTLPRSNVITGVPRDDLYLAEFSVTCGVCGVVAKTVLASQFLRNLIENLSEGILVVYNERRPTGFG